VLHHGHGAGPLKKKKDIGPESILTQLAMDKEYNCKDAEAADMAPVRLLARVFRSDKYYPKAETGEGANRRLKPFERFD